MTPRLITLLSIVPLGWALATACGSEESKGGGSGGSAGADASATGGSGGSAGGGATGGATGGSGGSSTGGGGGGGGSSGSGGGGGSEAGLVDVPPDYGPVPTCAEVCPYFLTLACVPFDQSQCEMFCDDNLNGPCGEQWGRLLACGWPDPNIACNMTDQPTIAGCFEAEVAFFDCYDGPGDASAD